MIDISDEFDRCLDDIIRDIYEKNPETSLVEKIESATAKIIDRANKTNQILENMKLNGLLDGLNMEFLVKENPLLYAIINNPDVLNKTNPERLYPLVLITVLRKQGYESSTIWSEIQRRLSEILGPGERISLILAGADFSRANLTEADLTRADLTRAKLIGAKLIGAKLTDADLTGTILTDKADLSGADLASAILIGAVFYLCNFKGAYYFDENGYKKPVTEEYLKRRGATVQGKCTFSPNTQEAKQDSQSPESNPNQQGSE